MATTHLQEEFKKRMDYDELMNCMRCGFCLPSCPTYAQTKNEAASPRGRIALMKGVVDGLIEPDEHVEAQLNLCLGCRACEPVCPSGVKYGRLLEEVRDIIEQNKKQSMKAKVLRNLAFKQLFPYQNRMRGLNSLLWLYQKSGVQKLAHATHMLSILPGNLADMESILPEIPSPKSMAERPRFLKPINLREQEASKRVAFFSGCLMDTMFMKTNDATLKLLQLAGCEIVNPQGQACCGALHAHSGEREGAKALAKRNIQAFEEVGADYIITNAGGCGALLIEYDHLLRDEPEWAERAKVFAAKIKDFSEVLVAQRFFEKVQLRLPKQKVTYQESCHLRNGMKATVAPRKLIQFIEGIDYIELPENQYCCGSAGIYNLVQREMSMSILDRKMTNVKKVEPNVIVSGNPGCLLQMKLGIKREGLENEMRAVHLADLLLEAVVEDQE